MLNNENITYKRGQVYAGVDGRQWVYWGAIRNYVSSDDNRPRSTTNKEVGRFYAPGHTPKGYYCPSHETKQADLYFDKLTFISTSVKDLELVNSGVDMKLIELIRQSIKDVKKLVNPDSEWSYDAVVYWMHGLERFIKCLNELNNGPFPNVCSGHHQLNSVLEKRLSQVELKELTTSIESANDVTIAELKKLAKTLDKERLKILNNFGVKRKYIEGYIEKYYDNPEKEFLDSLISNVMIQEMDFVNGYINIDNVSVAVDVSESASGSIVYWSHRNVGKATINGVEYTGNFYSSASHGWNYND
jgi:hypothetical protein